MPDAPVVDVQSSFTGVNLTADPTHLTPGEVTQAVNAKFTLFGGVTPRFGSQRMHQNALAGPVQGIYVWDHDPASLLPICVVAGGIFYAGVFQFGGVNPLALTALATVSSNQPPPPATFAQFTNASGANVLYFTVGQNLWSWNGNLTAPPVAISGSPNLGSIAVANQRLVGVFNSGTFQGNPGGAGSMNFYWSSLNNGDDIGVPSIPGAGGNAVITAFGQSYLTGVLPFQAGCIIAQRNGLAQFSGFGATDMSIQTGTTGISSDTGSPSPVGLCSVESFAIVASDRGAYIVTPYGFLEQISKPIEALWTAGMFVGLPAIFTNFVVHDKYEHSVYFMLGGGYTVANISGAPLANSPGIIGYNYRTQSWFGPWNFNWGTAGPSCACIAQNYYNLGPYVMIGGTDGYIRRIECPTLGLDDVLVDGTGGAPYTMSVTTRPLPGQSQGGPLWWTEKSWRYAYIQAQLQNPLGMSMTATTYPAQGQPNIQPLILPAIQNNQPDSSVRSYRGQIDSRGQWVQITITDTPANNPNGQNVYSSVRVFGNDVGERY